MGGGGRRPQGRGARLSQYPGVCASTATGDGDQDAVCTLQLGRGGDGPVQVGDWVGRCRHRCRLSDNIRTTWRNVLTGGWRRRGDSISSVGGCSSATTAAQREGRGGATASGPGPGRDCVVLTAAAAALSSRRRPCSTTSFATCTSTEAQLSRQGRVLLQQPNPPWPRVNDF
jgi:hypothetical protein